MIEFFIALFGSIYIISRLSRESMIKKSNSAKRAKYLETISNTLDFDKRNDLFYEFCDNPEGALNTISGNLERIFGLNWEEVYRQYPFDNKKVSTITDGHIRNIWEAAMHLFLSKNGIKIAKHYYCNAQVSPFPKEAAREYQIKILREIERNMVESHGNDFLLFVDPIETSRDKLCWGCFFDLSGRKKTKRLW